MTDALPGRSGTTIIPTLRYRNARTMIDWLCNAFGFETHALYADGAVVQHAQLVYGNGMIMLSSTDDTSDWGRRIVQPDAIEGRETQCPYVVVVDADAHCDRARAAGAVIVDEPSSPPYGGRSYSCRDPEGHVWCFGSYDPFDTHQ